MQIHFSIKEHALSAVEDHLVEYLSALFYPGIILCVHAQVGTSEFDEPSCMEPIPSIFLGHKYSHMILGIYLLLEKLFCPFLFREHRKGQYIEYPYRTLVKKRFPDTYDILHIIKSIILHHISSDDDAIGSTPALFIQIRVLAVKDITHASTEKSVYIVTVLCTVKSVHFQSFRKTIHMMLTCRNLQLVTPDPEYHVEQKRFVINIFKVFSFYHGVPLSAKHILVSCPLLSEQSHI